MNPLPPILQIPPVYIPPKETQEIDINIPFGWIE